MALWPNLSGGETLDLLGRLRGGTDPARPASLVERFALDPTRKGRSYSKGNRQKVALVAALASDAELVLLDEPTSGLDPLMEAEFRTCIAEEQRRESIEPVVDHAWPSARSGSSTGAFGGIVGSTSGLMPACERMRASRSATRWLVGSIGSGTAGGGVSATTAAARVQAFGCSINQSASRRKSSQAGLPGAYSVTG